MIAFLQKYLTTEAVFSITGAIWFVVSSIFPAIPQEMPMPALIPGLTAVTPGLLVAISLVPIVIKLVMPGKTAFVGTGASVTATNVPVDVTEQKDA